MSWPSLHVGRLCYLKIILCIPRHRFGDTFCGENFYFKFETPAHTATGGRLELSSNCLCGLQPGAPSASLFLCRTSFHMPPWASPPLLWGRATQCISHSIEEAPRDACTHAHRLYQPQEKEMAALLSPLRHSFFGTLAGPRRRLAVLRPHRLPASSCAGSSCTPRSSRPTA